MRFPQFEDRKLSENVFGAQTNSRAEAMACLTVLQHVHRSRDLRVHTYLKWPYANVLRIGSDTPQHGRRGCIVIYGPSCTMVHSNVQAKRYGLTSTTIGIQVMVEKGAKCM